MKLPAVHKNLVSGTVTTVFNRRESPRYWKLRVHLDSDSFDPEPGQFAHLRVSDEHNPLLRRPFSFHDVRETGETGYEIDFLYAVVGRGTNIMSNLSEGDTLNMLGPLGNHFSTPKPDEHPVLLGGGVGIPPIHMFSRKLSEEWTGNQPIDVLTGARSEEDVLCEEDFQQLDVNYHISTDDGSRGFHGYVTQLFEERYDREESGKSLRLYGCGPEGMLDAIRSLALDRDLPAEIAIERQMGCALGVCRACVVKVRDPESNDGPRVATVCREGPVFDVRKLLEDWQNA